MHRILFSRVSRTYTYQTNRGNVQLAAQPSTQTDNNIENARPYSEIPGPKPWPIIGNGWRFLPGIGTIPSDHYLNLMKLMYKTYGPISKITNIPGKRDLVFLYDPQDFETVFRNEGQWPLRPVFDSFPYYRNVTRKDIFQGVGGILSVNGEKWQEFRSFVNPILMKAKNANMYTSRIDEVTNDFIELIPEILDKKNEVPDNFAKEIKKWSLESAALIALDTRLNCLNRELDSDSEPNKLIHAADEIFELYFSLDVGFPLWKYFSTPSWKRYVKSLDFFTYVCMKHISQAQKNVKHYQNIDEMSMLQQLLMKDPDPKKAFVMALDTMLSGIDTTSNTVACLLYHLARHPEVQQQLYEELRKALPQKDSPITIEILSSLKYLKACVREGNRVTPIVCGTGRCVPVDIVLSNYHIPKNTDVLMCNSVITNLEEFFPEANKFKPERWIKSIDSECPMHKPHPFAMLPFGFGKRNCVGMRLALLELEIIVARMIRNYKLEWHYDNMRFTSRAVYTPADPLKFRIFSR